MVWKDIFVGGAPQPEVLAKGWVVAWRVDAPSVWAPVGGLRCVVEVKLEKSGEHVAVDVPVETFQKIREQNENGGYSKIAIVLMSPKEK